MDEAGRIDAIDQRSGEGEGEWLWSVIVTGGEYTKWVAALKVSGRRGRGEDLAQSL